MSSPPPEFRRPHDPATSERQQRSALCGEPVGGHACSSVISTLKLSLVEPDSTTRTPGALYRITMRRVSCELNLGNPNTRRTVSHRNPKPQPRQPSQATAAIPRHVLVDKVFPRCPLLRCLPSFLERDAIEGESPGLLSPETSI